MTNYRSGHSSILDRDALENSYYDEEAVEIISGIREGVVDGEDESNSGFLQFNTGRGRL